MILFYYFSSSYFLNFLIKLQGKVRSVLYFVVVVVDAADDVVDDDADVVVVLHCDADF